MAASRTRARPAGREQRAATKKDEPITAAESANGEKPKRGRGRPPKNGVSKVVKVPSGRPRGRPPKDPSQKVTPNVTKPAASTGRGRGRPPKSGAAATPKKTATPSKATSASKAAGSAKSRPGRPRKSEPAEEEEEEEEADEDEDISGAEEIKDGDSDKEFPLQDEGTS